MADPLGTASVDLLANTGSFEKGMDRVQRGMRSVSKEAAYQKDQLSKLVGQINPTISALDKLDKQQEQLAAHQKAGRIDLESYGELNKKLDEQRQALGGVDQALEHGGQTAKQYANNLRGIPAQFTDIVVSLQGGQKPLTVLLQQGGQLKDLFGGAGNALKAVGGYILGLVNPITITAAALAALGLAYKQGSDEQTAYTKALAVSGNYAGTSSDEMAKYAKSISSVTISQHEAAAVIAEVAASGKFTSSELVEVSKAALDFQNATGQAVDKTIDEFKRLADDPIKASKALNDQYNYLTASVYSQIKALEEEGYTAAAAKVAIDALADAHEKSSKTIEDNLGVVEKAWVKIKGAASQAWDSMLDVGRTKTLEEQLAALDKIQSGSNITQGAVLTGRENQLPQHPTADNSVEKARLVAAIALRDQNAKIAGERAQDQKAAILAIDKIDQLTKDSLTNEQKRNLAIKEYRQELEAIRKVSPDDLRLDPDSVNKNIANINERFKDKRQPKVQEDAGQKLLGNLRDQYAVLDSQNQALNNQDKIDQKLGTNAQELIKFEQQIADIKTYKTLTADQKSLLASQDLIEAQLKRNVALEQTVAQHEAINKAVEAYQKLSDQLDANGKSQLAVTRERFKVLEDSRKTLEGTPNAISDDEYKQRQGQIAAASVTPLPKFDGLINSSIGGKGGQIGKIDDAEKTLEKAYQTQLDLLNKNRQAQQDAGDDWDQQEIALTKDHNDKMAALDQAKGKAQLDLTAQVFGNLASLSQSKNKDLANIGKAAAIAQATISGIEAVVNALAIPPYPLGLALSISAGVLAATNVAKIAGVQFKEGGYTGDVGVNDLAGFVHGKEFVFDAGATARIGVGNLETLRSGKPSPSVSSIAQSLSNTNPQTRSGPMQLTQNIIVSGQADNRTTTQIARASERQQRLAQARFG